MTKPCVRVLLFQDRSPRLATYSHGLAAASAGDHNRTCGISILTKMWHQVANILANCNLLAVNAKLQRGNIQRTDRAAANCREANGAESASKNHTAPQSASEITLACAGCAGEKEGGGGRTCCALQHRCRRRRLDSEQCGGTRG